MPVREADAVSFGQLTVVAMTITCPGLVAGAVTLFAATLLVSRNVSVAVLNTRAAAFMRAIRPGRPTRPPAIDVFTAPPFGFRLTDNRQENNHQADHAYCERGVHICRETRYLQQEINRKVLQSSQTASNSGYWDPSQPFYR